MQKFKYKNFKFSNTIENKIQKRISVSINITEKILNLFNFLLMLMTLFGVMLKV